MAQRIAVIMIKEGKILLVHRIKKSKEYYVIPGGGIEKDENIEQAAVREIKEETGLDIVLGRKLYEKEDRSRLESYFLAKSFNGELKLGKPEIDRQSKDNVYLLEWVSLKDLREINLLPESIKNKIFDTFSY